MDHDIFSLSNFSIKQLQDEIIRQQQQKKNEELEEFQEDFNDFIECVRSLKDKTTSLREKWDDLTEKYGCNRVKDSKLFFELISDSTLLYFYALGLSIDNLNHK